MTDTVAVPTGSAPPDRTEPNHLLQQLRQGLRHVGNWLGFLALALPVLGAVWICVYSFSTPGEHVTYLGVGLMTSLAVLLIGCLAGFLFGIPKVVSSGQLRQTTDANRYTPSSNLAEVSDWLTKLLLGAGLVQLTHLGAPLAGLINHIAGGLAAVPASAGPPESAKVMAGAIVFGFAAIGFLDGYVVTTVWYQKKIAELTP